MIKKSVIISAGGIGKRMESELPKQFIVINRKPIIFHTIDKFMACQNNIELIIVLPADWINYWEELCQKYYFTAGHKVVIGGAERFYSIQNGLAEVSGDLVAVHDAVRPMVSVDLIRNCFATAEKFGSAVPVIPIRESIRKTEGEKSFVVNREDYLLVQTPQCFSTTILANAYQQPYSRFFTDDASVVEASGCDICLIEGDEQNFKLTRPFDLQLATLLL